jgi:hypothetical protein
MLREWRGFCLCPQRAIPTPIEHRAVIGTGQWRRRGPRSPFSTPTPRALKRLHPDQSSRRVVQSTLS